MWGLTSNVLSNIITNELCFTLIRSVFSEVLNINMWIVVLFLVQNIVSWPGGVICSKVQVRFRLKRIRSFEQITNLNWHLSQVETRDDAHIDASDSRLTLQSVWCAIGGFASVKPCSQAVT